METGVQVEVPILLELLPGSIKPAELVQVERQDREQDEGCQTGCPSEYRRAGWTGPRPGGGAVSHSPQWRHLDASS